MRSFRQFLAFIVSAQGLERGVFVIFGWVVVVWKRV